MADIDPSKWYSARQVANSAIFPWITSLPTLRRWIHRHPSLFKPIVKGEGSGRRYYLKGSVIVDIVRRAEKGEVNFIKTDKRVLKDVKKEFEVPILSNSSDLVNSVIIDSN